MVPAWLQPLLDWLSAHPHWAGLVIFAVAMAESLVLVGVLVPGAIIMLSAGALVALGAMPLGSTLAWATAGAVVGDGISYWLGYFYKERLTSMGPFRRYPKLLERGEDFFRRHGAKSVFLGRFVGPIRAVIPTVAGIMGMRPLRFTVVNVVSAICWAPAYILPGMVFGASLGLASEVATRLAILAVVMLAALWLVIWIVRALFNAIQPRTAHWMTLTWQWAANHPAFSPLLTPILDPQRPPSRALLGLAVILLGSGAIFLAVLGRVLEGTGEANLSETVYYFLQGLRTPGADQVMVTISQLGDAAVTVPVTGILALWLIWRRHFSAARYWLSAVIFTAALTTLLKQLLGAPRPAALLYDGPSLFAFPSGHAAVSTAIYGFLAVMVAHEMAPARRWIPYTLAATMVTLIAFSRLYLGAHWLTDVVGGLALGLAWIALLGIAYRRHAQSRIHGIHTALVAMAAVTVSAGWHVAVHHDREMARYAPAREPQVQTAEHWRQSGWGDLPVYRLDYIGEREEPLTVQWAAPLDEVRTALHRLGWQAPRNVTVANALMWLTPEPAIETLPILPQIHHGRYESLIMVQSAADSGTQWVLRLWESELRLADGRPVWVGTVSSQQLKKLALVTARTTGDRFDAPLTALQQQLGADAYSTVQRQATRIPLPDEPVRWAGDVILVGASAGENK